MHAYTGTHTRTHTRTFTRVYLGLGKASNTLIKALAACRTRL